MRRVSISLIFLFCVVTQGNAGPNDQANPSGSERKLTLPAPIDRILPGGGDLFMAISQQDGKVFLIDTSGVERATVPFEGEVPFVLPFDVIENGARGFIMITKQKTDASTSGYVFRFFHWNEDDGPGETRRFRATEEEDLRSTDAVPMEFREPAAAALLEADLILIWDHTINQAGSAIYRLMQDPGNWSDIRVTHYPYEVINIGEKRFVLGLYPGRNSVSLIDVRTGVVKDSIYVDGLSFSNPALFAIFTPGSIYAGTDKVIVANGESELLTILSVEKGGLPRMTSPIQVSLKGLDGLRGARGRILVTADRALSLILVGQVGGARLSVFRKVGGGLLPSPPIDLKMPIRDMTALNGPNSNDPEVFAFLNENKKEITVIPPDKLIPSDKLIAPELTTKNSIIPEPVNAKRPSMGSINPSDTATVQRILAELGYRIGVIDGIMGPQTIAAIRGFQLEKNLQPTGTVGSQTSDALESAFRKINRNTEIPEVDSQDYSAFLQEQVQGIDAARLLTLGVANANPRHPCFGLNSTPPQDLWPNSVAFAKILKRIEERFNFKVQIVSAYRNQEYNQCVDNEPFSKHLTFQAFDIRLADAKTFSESNTRLMEALEKMKAAGELPARFERHRYDVHVETGADSDTLPRQ